MFLKPLPHDIVKRILILARSNCVCEYAILSKEWVNEFGAKEPPIFSCQWSIAREMVDRSMQVALFCGHRLQRKTKFEDYDYIMQKCITDNDADGIRFALTLLPTPIVYNYYVGLANKLGHYDLLKWINFSSLSESND